MVGPLVREGWMKMAEKSVRERARKSSNVTIPYSLYLKVREHIKGTTFRSVSEYVTYLVRRSVENERK